MALIKLCIVTLNELTYHFYPCTACGIRTHRYWRGPLEAIMERLGYANDDITRTIYLHITKQTKKNAAQKFYELMNGGSQ